MTSRCLSLACIASAGIHLVLSQYGVVFSHVQVVIGSVPLTSPVLALDILAVMAGYVCCGGKQASLPCMAVVQIFTAQFLCIILERKVMPAG